MGVSAAWQLLSLAVSAGVAVADRVQYIRIKLSGHVKNEIKRSWEGGASNSLEKVCIFSGFCPKGVPDSTIEYVKVLWESGFAVQYISNSPLRESDFSRLHPYVNKIVERHNFGRDFSGYKTGLLMLEQIIQTQTDRLLLANDSVFFPVCDPAAVMAALGGEFDVLGATDSFEQYYHIQSYFVAFSRSVLTSDAFWNFWHSYVPYSSRQHAIVRGEIGLSKSLHDAGFSVSAIYTGSDLYTALLNVPAEEYLPVCGSFSLPTIRTLGRDMRVLEDRGLIEAKRVWPRIVANAMRHVEVGSIMHLAAGPFLTVLKCPFVKKDLCFRGLYDFFFISHLFQNQAHLDADEVIAAYRIRGIRACQPFVVRMAQALGLR